MKTTRIVWEAGVVTALFVLAGAVAAQEIESEAEITPEGPSRPVDTGGRDWISGRFDAGVDLQWDDRSSDQNFDQFLRLEIDPASHPRLHLRGSLWMHEDFDKGESRTSTLRDINDGFDSDVRARLLGLHLDIDDLWGDSVLRIGRQRILEGVAFNRMDGLYFRKDLARWEWYAFGGVRASIYEDAHNDRVFGGGIAVRPGRKTRIALDTFYGEEDRSGGDVVFRRPVVNLLGLDFPRRIKDELSEKAYSLSVWHDLTPNVRLFGQYIIRDDEGGDEYRLSATGYVPSWQLTYELTVRGQLTASGDQVNDLTSFFRILGRFEPYYNVLFAVHRPVTERIFFSIEAELQDSENDDPLSGNRDYERYAAVVTFEDAFKGADITVSLERWSVTGGEGTYAITGEITREWPRFVFTAGTDFERYEDRFVEFRPLPQRLEELTVTLLPNVFPRFNPLVQLFDTGVVETHENVYSVFTEGKYKIRNNQDVMARLRFEEDDGPDSPYWRLQAEYSIRF